MHVLSKSEAQLSLHKRAGTNKPLYVRGCGSVSSRLRFALE